jgi:hypothetical protein
MSSKEPLYKVLDDDATPYHGGHGKWNTQGKWMPPIKGDLIPCRNGYHLCRKQDLVYWLGPSIWLAAYRGERIDQTEKIVVREARVITRLDTWNDRTARLFACDCAERALTKYVENPDPRSLNAIKVARQYANGAATDEQLAAAWDAAWDAAVAAGWAAAVAAAGEAARAAAGEAERKWQTKRLFEYLEGKRP